MAYPQRDICIIVCLQGGIRIISILPSRHSHHGMHQGDICIMTYPLEGICTTRFLHLHLCKKTFASRLNMCTDTIIDKLFICTLAWDICIMKITSLKGDMCIIWTFRICILVKRAFASEMKNLDLHHILFAFIEKIDI